jgi:hypothetical protein
MRMKRSLVFFFFGTWVLTGCAAHRYRAAPIVPTESASRLESRSLGDSALKVFLEENVGHSVAPWPPKTWDLGMLSLAALYFDPTLIRGLTSRRKAGAFRVRGDMVPLEGPSGNMVETCSILTTTPNAVTGP